MRFLKDHELSLWLLVIWLLMTGIGLALPDNKIGQFVSNHAGEMFGALVVVFTQQVLRLRERGKNAQGNEGRES